MLLCMSTYVGWAKRQVDNPKLELKLRPVAPTPEPSDEVSEEVSDHGTFKPDGVLWIEVHHVLVHCAG